MVMELSSPGRIHGSVIFSAAALILATFFTGVNVFCWVRLTAVRLALRLD
jgi:hypothetical protein